MYLALPHTPHNKVGTEIATSRVSSQAYHQRTGRISTEEGTNRMYRYCSSSAYINLNGMMRKPRFRENLAEGK